MSVIINTLNTILHIFHSLTKVIILITSIRGCVMIVKHLSWILYYLLREATAYTYGLCVSYRKYNLTKSWTCLSSKQEKAHIKPTKLVFLHIAMIFYLPSTKKTQEKDITLKNFYFSFFRITIMITFSFIFCCITNPKDLIQLLRHHIYHIQKPLFNSPFHYC